MVLTPLPPPPSHQTLISPNDHNFGMLDMHYTYSNHKNIKKCKIKKFDFTCPSYPFTRAHLRISHKNFGRHVILELHPPHIPQKIFKKLLNKKCHILTQYYHTPISLMLIYEKWFHLINFWKFFKVWKTFENILEYSSTI